MKPWLAHNKNEFYWDLYVFYLTSVLKITPKFLYISAGICCY